MIITAFDPGKTTGIARLTPPSRQPKLKQITYDDLLTVCGLAKTSDLVICEDFVWQRRHSVDFHPLKVMGVIEFAMQTSGADYVKQTASQGKTFWTDDKLKAISLYKPGLPHAMDALRHLLHYMTFNRKDNYWLERYGNAS